MEKGLEMVKGIVGMQGSCCGSFLLYGVDYNNRSSVENSAGSIRRKLAHFILSYNLTDLLNEAKITYFIHTIPPSNPGQKLPHQSFPLPFHCPNLSSFPPLQPLPISTLRLSKYLRPHLSNIRIEDITHIFLPLIKNKPWKLITYRISL